ncbi:MAG: ATP-binding protein [Synechococcus sp.]
MLSILRKPVNTRSAYTLSFVSTLYVRPILDLLVLEVPPQWQAEIRLGLQEALVNAVAHGNQHDPAKRVTVTVSSQAPLYKWVISDEGGGFDRRCWCDRQPHDGIDDTDECGRGVFILKQIFDCVEWNGNGNELHLMKAIQPNRNDPLIP